MGVKDHTKFEQETQRCGKEQVSQAADMSFKICQKWPNNTLFWAIWLRRMSMEGGISIGANLDDEQTPLITV